jgi:hypothetical protein
VDVPVITVMHVLVRLVVIGDWLGVGRCHGR